jgi:hypothetical protein
VDGLGYLLDAVVYYIVTVGLVAAAITRVDSRTPVPWASRWRIRGPILATATGPVLFVVLCVCSLPAAPTWLLAGLAVAALGAPWVGAGLITVEWLRRRAEDRATGLERPFRM